MLHADLRSAHHQRPAQIRPGDSRPDRQGAHRQEGRAHHLAHCTARPLPGLHAYRLPHRRLPQNRLRRGASTPQAHSGPRARRGLWRIHRPHRRRGRFAKKSCAPTCASCSTSGPTSRSAPTPSKSPALIYHDLALIERILRDQVSTPFPIWVDTEDAYERVLRFLQRFQPSLIRRVKLYLKDTPLFEQFGITEEINKALRSKVWLKSGGSIVINQTEALVAIDINTGKFVGKTARLEDTIVKTNLDAIPEIVRQIRLRDLGGIIIIDFIDMDERSNRNRVMAALEDELKSDRAPSKVLQFNDFGLVAITRKRVKQSLERTLSTPCTVCQGTGMVKSPVTVCNDIYIEMRKMHKHLDRGDVMLRVHPEVVKQLKASGAKWLQEMEEMVGKTILVKSDPALHPEQFDIH